MAAADPYVDFSEVGVVYLAPASRTPSTSTSAILNGFGVRADGREIRLWVPFAAGFAGTGDAATLFHETGHLLGLPDLYLAGSPSTFHRWDLMAATRRAARVSHACLGAAPRAPGPGSETAPIASALRRHNPRMLPEGVAVHPLEPHPDERGVFTELFRESWSLPVAPVQWNAVRSEANVLRGVHAHWRHWDYLTLVAGRATIGLHDLREGSPTERLGAAVELAGDSPSALVIPTGVAHGFHFHEPSIHVYAVTHEWDPTDELGCRWDDPALQIRWPCTDPRLSERDRGLGSLSALREAFRTALAAV